MISFVLQVEAKLIWVFFLPAAVLRQCLITCIMTGQEYRLHIAFCFIQDNVMQCDTIQFKTM